MTEASIWNPTVDSIDSELRAILQESSGISSGAGYVGYDPMVAYQAGSTGKALKDLATEVNNIVAETTVGYTSILTFGAVGDGVADDTAAFIAAMAATDRIYLPNPPVAYRVNSQIPIVSSNIKFLGESRYLTKIRAYNAALPVFQISPGLSNVELNNFRVERSVAPSPTGTGIECSGISTDFYLRDLVLEGHWDGMILGETGAGQLINCHASENYGNGLRLYTGAGQFILWDIRDSTFTNNDANGILVQATGVASEAALGAFSNNYCALNTQYGLRVEGSVSKKVNSVRLSGGVYTYNGAGGIYLDTYGRRHRLAEVSANLSGTVATGRGNATAASLNGSGIVVTSNNQEFNLVGSYANQNAGNGLQCGAAVANIVGNTVSNNTLNGMSVNSALPNIVGNTAAANSLCGMTVSGATANIVGNNAANNGQNGSAAAIARAGLALASSTASVQANTFCNTGGGTTQQHGISLTDCTNSVIDGNNCSPNAVSGVVVAGTSTGNRLTANPGYNNFAMDTVTPGASPWTYTAGPTHEDIYIKGGTLTLITSEGVTLATAASAATAYHLVPLTPNQSLSITYSVVPTVLRKKR